LLFLMFIGSLGRQAPGGSFVFLIGKGNESRHFGGDASLKDVWKSDRRGWYRWRGELCEPAHMLTGRATQAR
jgi:hypothetical protein